MKEVSKDDVLRTFNELLSFCRVQNSGDVDAMYAFIHDKTVMDDIRKIPSDFEELLHKFANTRRVAARRTAAVAAAVSAMEQTHAVATPNTPPTSLPNTLLHSPNSDRSTNSATPNLARAACVAGDANATGEAVQCYDGDDKLTIDC
jgi:hypothetical protein